MKELRVRNLSVRIGCRVILDNVSFEASSRDVIGLIGPNGAGKSTLLKALLGLIPASGTVTLFGRPDLSPRERAQRSCYVPQDREIAWPLSVRDVISLGRTPYLTATRGITESDNDLIDEAMRLVGVSHLSERNVLELSGGERARVLIARALAQNAPLLLADEPAAGLDPAHQIALMEMIAARANCLGLAIVSVHDMGLAARWCNRLLVLHNGHLVADGPPHEVMVPEMFASVYGIEVAVTAGAMGPLVNAVGLIG